MHHGLEKFTQLSGNWLKSSSAMLKKYKDIDDESKELISQTLEALRKAARKQIFDRFTFPKKKLKRKNFAILSK